MRLTSSVLEFEVQGESCKWICQAKVDVVDGLDKVVEIAIDPQGNINREFGNELLDKAFRLLGVPGVDFMKFRPIPAATSSNFRSTPSLNRRCFLCDVEIPLRTTLILPTQIDEIEDGSLIGFEELIADCHRASLKAGWWKRDQNLAEKLMLIVSEISEAMEGLRKDQLDDKLPHRLMEEVELADACIRIFDYVKYRDFDLVGAIKEKMAYNAERPDHKLENREKDGGKKF